MKMLIALLWLLASCSQNVVPVPPVNPVTPVNPDAPKHATGFNYKPGQKGLIVGAPFALAPVNLEIPKSFSWVSLGYATPVRDQGQCGSCYCFGGTQPLDGAAKIYENKDVTVSEQQCVAYSGFYGCGGGDFPFDILKAGLTTDAACPYHADGRGCPGGKPTTIALRADDAKNLGDGVNPPTVPQIQQGIMQYGYLSCDVAATSAWDSFTGTGLLSGNSNGINHIVAIVGWSGEMQAWLVKNSWGTSFGNGGYAWIPYGNFSLCQDVGFVQYSSLSAISVAKQK